MQRIELWCYEAPASLPQAGVIVQKLNRVSDGIYVCIAHKQRTHAHLTHSRRHASRNA
jgi:hypothetical protein